MKRPLLFLMLIGVFLGLVAHQPAQALAAPMGSMNMTSLSANAMASMPECMPAMKKDATQTPCKCGLAGCIAMMASGTPMMLPDGQVAIGALIASERVVQIAASAVLQGRSTAPEPEPPSPLI